MANEQATARIRQLILQKEEEIEHLSYTLSVLADPTYDRIDSREEADDLRSEVLEGLATANERTRRAIEAERELAATARSKDKALAPISHRRQTGEANPPKLSH